MSDADVPAGVLTLVERIAGAIRAELGAAIDADPGLAAPEQADPLDRVFRAVVRALLEAGGTPGPSLPALVAGTLRRAAEYRLAAEGWDDRQVTALIEGEAGSPDDWLAFLLLSSRARIGTLPELDDNEQF